MALKLDKPMSFKTAVLEAFHRLGGVDSMVMWAVENPTEFYRIASRLIPTELAGADGTPLQITINRLSLSDPSTTAIQVYDPTPASGAVVDISDLA